MKRMGCLLNPLCSSRGFFLMSWQRDFPRHCHVDYWLRWLVDYGFKSGYLMFKVLYKLNWSLCVHTCVCVGMSWQQSEVLRATASQSYPWHNNLKGTELQNAAVSYERYKPLTHLTVTHANTSEPEKACPTCETTIVNQKMSHEEVWV